MRDMRSASIRRRPLRRVRHRHAAGLHRVRVGDGQVELGFIDRRGAPAGEADNTPGAVVVAWHVDDLGATVETLLAMGATEHEPITEQGGAESGFVTGSVVDPFGN